MRRGPRSGPLRAAALTAALLAVVVGVGGELAGADAPTKQGWWSRWQDAPPTTLPGGIAVPVTLPAPPTGEEGGLTVALGPDGVQAVAAMFFETDEGAGATLYLKAAKSGGTEKPFAVPPGGSVAACAVLSPWQHQLNGPWRNAPTWRNDDCAPGTITPTNTAMFWTLPPTLQDPDGNYDIVLVPRFVAPQPGPAGNAPFIVHFAVPDAATLVAEELDPTTTTTTTTEPEESTTTTTEPIVVTEETDPFVSYEVGGDRGGMGPGTPVVTTTPRVPKQRTTLVAFDPSSLPRSFPVPDTRAERIFAVSVLFFMATALWWLGGNPTRMPRLIGALASDGRGVRPPPPPQHGVGRFARPRPAAARPPRL